MPGMETIPSDFPLRSWQDDERKLFEVGPEKCPPVGGCVDITLPHSNHLLTPEVALYEPTHADIFEGGSPSAPSSGRRNRQIFLNTALMESELEDLRKLHKTLEQEAGSEAFPAYVKSHVLRMIQHRKGDMKKTMALIKMHMTERVARLPIPESEVLDDMRKGFVYWHGRDRSCRPCLVISLGRMKEFKHDKERAVRLVMFTLEYGLRYAMVPGRVENWVVLIDLFNISSVVSVSTMFSTIGTIKAISETLESVYCGRMVWLKIFNMPGFLRKPVASVIPAEKAKKVGVVHPAETQKTMRELMEPHQLEARFGGTAPDCSPEEVYPFRFFPDATCGSNGCGHEEIVGIGHGNESLHSHTSLEFHEGALWDHSTDKAKEEWFQAAQAQSLPPGSAAALSALPGAGQVEPCCNLTKWLELVDPVEAENRIQATPSSRIQRTTSGMSEISKMSDRFTMPLTPRLQTPTSMSKQEASSPNAEVGPTSMSLEDTLVKKLSVLNETPTSTRPAGSPSSQGAYTLDFDLDRADGNDAIVGEQTVTTAGTKWRWLCCSK
jgi:hypothetical protein